MLVIKRKDFSKTGRHESVFIELDGKVIAEVSVVKAMYDGVRLGFTADESVKFVRSELKSRPRKGS